MVNNGISRLFINDMLPERRFVFVGDKVSKKNESHGIPFINSNSLTRMIYLLRSADIFVGDCLFINKEDLKSLFSQINESCGWNPKIILLGKNSKELFEADFKHYNYDLALPHPSGLNRFWNDRSNTESVIEKLRLLKP